MMGLRACTVAAIWAGCMVGSVAGAQQKAVLPSTILYGAAYYEEYSPTDRLDEDVRMMKATGITVVRIAESTWGTLETSPGVFDFSHVDRVLHAMDKAGIRVIVGTPTYAFPTWLAREHPEVMAITPRGPGEYGRRQNMDITSPVFREAAQRVIVALVDHVKDHPSVIGYQLDNETKYYDTSGPNVQAAFVAWIRKRHPDLNELNQAFGLNYWSKPNQQLGGFSFGQWLDQCEFDFGVPGVSARAGDGVPGVAGGAGAGARQAGAVSDAEFRF